MASAPTPTSLPAAEFIDDVDKHMQGQRIEERLAQLEGTLRAYRQAESGLLLRRARLQERLPEIKLALQAVLGLLARQDDDQALLVDYELTESIYAKAALSHVTAVNLWLGANVMVEYPLGEAQALLEQQRVVCEASLDSVGRELEAVKGSIATTEVSMARVFNWDVEQRRKAKAAGGAQGTQQQQQGGVGGSAAAAAAAAVAT